MAYLVPGCNICWVSINTKFVHGALGRLVSSKEVVFEMRSLTEVACDHTREFSHLRAHAEALFCEV